MERLSNDDANHHLSKIGLCIGKNGELTYLTNGHGESNNWFNYRAPSDALKLVVLSQHVAGWIPSGSWKILKLDCSNMLRADESLVFFEKHNYDRHISELMHSAFIFVLPKDKSEAAAINLSLAHKIFLLLLYQGHGHITSSSTNNPGQILSIQDGFVYFVTKGDSGHTAINEARSILECFEREPLCAPDWVLDFLSKADDMK